MTDSKTATERLREMLDARGVEYEESTQGNTTFFQFDYCEQCGGYMKSIVITGECISAYSDYLTPEQAVAATLGSNEKLCLRPTTRTSIASTALIADGLRIQKFYIPTFYIPTSDTLRSGECEFKPFAGEDWSEPNDVRGVCSECSALMYGKDNFCPHCGKKVKR